MNGFASGYRLTLLAPESSNRMRCGRLDAGFSRPNTGYHTVGGYCSDVWISGSEGRLAGLRSFFGRAVCKRAKHSHWNLIFNVLELDDRRFHPNSDALLRFLHVNRHRLGLHVAV